MFKRTVKVLEVYEHRAKVSFERSADCQHCLSKFFCKIGNEAIVIDTDGFDLKKGDKIEVGVEYKKNISSVVLIFIAPLLIFISALIALKGWGEAQSFFSAIILVSLYYLLLKFYLKNKDKDFRLQVIRKL
jgi:positive regulator of sigma E activity